MSRRAGALLALLLLAPTAAGEPFDRSARCADASGPARRVPALRVRGRALTLLVLWREDVGRAAGALLLRALARHARCERAHCRLALCAAPAPDLCRVTAQGSNVDVLDAIVAGFESPSALGCTDTPRLVDAVGGPGALGPAPLSAPRVHVALSRAAAGRPACLAAAERGFHERASAEELRGCGLDGARRWTPEPAPADAAGRRRLSARVLDEGRNTSFLFEDGELWADRAPRVLAVRAERPERALLAAERRTLVQHAPWLLEALRAHREAPGELRALLERERGPAEGAGRARSEAALRAARTLPQHAQHARAQHVERYVVPVLLCCGAAEEAQWQRPPPPADAIPYSEPDPRNCTREFYLLDNGLRALLEHMSETYLRARGLDPRLSLQLVDCGSGAHAASELTALLTRGGAHRLLGAVLEGAGATAAASLGARRALPVLAFDAQPPGAALLTGARAGVLARALARALAACGWRRAALLSERGAAGDAVRADLLRAAPGPLRLAPLPRADAELRATLRRLRAEGARVLVLNARGAEARRALALAAEEGLTPERGYAWLAREWAGPGAPPLTPLLALGAAPRGPGGALPDDAAFAPVLTTTWGAGDWPARAAPLADAIATLLYGFAQLFEKREDLRFDHRAPGTVEAFREHLANGASVPGVLGDLTFDAHGARPPRVLLELWRAGRAAPDTYEPDACPARRVPDAPRPCRLPAGGDAFAPAACLDAAVAVGAPALLLVALLGALGLRELRRRREARELRHRRRLRALAGAELIARQPHACAELAELLVDRERVTLLRALGAGRHGRVWLAELAPGGAELAAKAPHAGCAPAEEGELLREASALAPLRHPHVVRLLGVCVGPGPPLLLTAVAAHGDLLGYLRARRPPGGEAREAPHVAAEALTRLAREAALALAYLASRGLVHRDVRAANCLVDERRELKLADFGMARPLGGAPDAAGGPGDGYYRCRRRALFPVLWMAPESLARGAFSAASDVWALGALALELVTLGARPFGALSATRAVELVRRGGHARPPAHSSAETRALLRACWRREPAERPPARALAAWLSAHPAALAPRPAPDPPPDRSD